MLCNQLFTLLNDFVTSKLPVCDGENLLEENVQIATSGLPFGDEVNWLCRHSRTYIF